MEGTWLGLYEAPDEVFLEEENIEYRSLEGREFGPEFLGKSTRLPMRFLGGEGEIRDEVSGQGRGNI